MEEGSLPEYQTFLILVTLKKNVARLYVRCEAKPILGGTQQYSLT